VTEKGLFWTFIIIHFFLYPASNGYNSYFDKDEKSIGGLEKPPPVTKGLYFLALLFDVIAVVLGYIKISLTFSIMLVIYGLVSKAYSHPDIRLKKYPIVGWLVTGLFQGFFTLMMCYVGINGFPLDTSLTVSVLIPAILCTIMLWANYPMTQIYQHEEDGKRGDETFSRMLGIRGTFYFVGAVFGLTSILFTLYYYHYLGWTFAMAYLIAMSPVVAFFGYWFMLCSRDIGKADFRHTMWLNRISATCLNGFFLYVFLYGRNYIQLFG
jgi:1,4-dihydroxy-2-naphthoate octaprenyltransferase